MLANVKKAVVGIRREDPKRIWERRVPLTPDAVYNLIASGKADVQVVPCTRRVFKDAEYVKAGASLVPTLSDADIVLGIKEPPIDEIPTATLFPKIKNGKRKHQTYFMFSHTHKGQPYNTPLLSRFLDPHAKPRMDSSSSLLPNADGQGGNPFYPTLVDYELLKNEQGKRTVAFGWFAGLAGVLESLSAMAHRHLELGIASPFLYTPRPHTLPSLTQLRTSLRAIGDLIANEGTPSALGPVVIGLTGNGNVSQGCLSMLAELPIEHVDAKDLEALVRRGDADLTKIYLVHVKPQDFLVRMDGGEYTREHYYQSPQSYESVFAERIAPYLTLLLNGIGWSASFPRLMSNVQLGVALERAKDVANGREGIRLGCVGDISCDVEGGLEFMTRATTLSEPTFVARAPRAGAFTSSSTQTQTGQDTSGPGVTVMSVDILPASIPLDASMHFSDALGGYLGAVLDGWGRARAADASVKIKEEKGATTAPSPLQEAIENATIASGGALRAPYRWLGAAVGKYFEESGRVGVIGKEEVPPVKVEAKEVQTQDALVQPKTKILMLGSGMVAQPAVDYIARRRDVELMIASNSLLELQTLAGPHHNVKYRIIDASRPETFVHLIKDAQVVISLLPAPMHPPVAQLCVEHATHLLTASYISPQIAALHPQAERAGVLLLNEMGLDPGLDHCSAVAILEKMKKEGKKVVGFTSFCGGLPRWEDVRMGGKRGGVGLGYKFSWNPAGVLRALENDAKFLARGGVHRIEGKMLLRNHWSDIPISRDFPLEGLPNRDSLDYPRWYGLDRKELQTFVRGTLRYPGFTDLMQTFRKIGLLNAHKRIVLTDWSTFVNQALTLQFRSREGILPSLREIVPAEHLPALSDALEGLGLISTGSGVTGAAQEEMPPLPEGPATPLEIFGYLLSRKLRYEPNETDVVVLSHQVVVVPEGTKPLESIPSPSSYSGTTVPLGSAFPRREAQEAPGCVYPDARKQTYTSTLITYGTQRNDAGFPGERPASAMARTVGIPLAIAALLVADGKLDRVGVMRPTTEDIYGPVLSEMEKVGLGMREGWGVGEGSGSVVEAVERGFGGKRVDQALLGLGMREFVDLDLDRGWKEEEAAEWRA